MGPQSWLSKLRKLSVRTLLILALLLAVPAAVISHRANAQRRAMEWVEEQGGWCYYHHQYDGPAINPNEPLDVRINSRVLYSDPPVPQGVLNYMGIDHFCCVREVWIAEDAEMDVEFLGGLQGVELLTLHEDLPQPKLQRVRELFPNTRIEPFDSNNEGDEP
jgi:hypothetical protein